MQKHKKRRALGLSAATAALVTAFSVPASAAEPNLVYPPDQVVTPSALTPSYGDIGAFYGDLDAFYGDIGAFYGDIGAFYGDLNAFYGDIGAFYGDIGAFYGDIGAFYGDLNAFYGDLNAFYGDIGAFYGDIGAFKGDLNTYWGDIGAFWGDLNAFYGDINAFWDGLGAYNEDSADNYDDLAGKFNAFIETSKTRWVNAVRAKTGKGFNAGFARAMLAKHGIDLSRPETLADMSPAARARFFIDWHDQLMTFAGIDHVDHWMNTVNWSPKIAQDAGLGKGVIVGIVDTRIDANIGLLKNYTVVGGHADQPNQHGAAVASLIAAKHDGKGVMGVAPEAKIKGHNPFDHTGRADWTEVTDAVKKLSQKKASVINLSLGHPDYVLHQEWVNILSDPSIRNISKDTVLVKAAGNAGKMQSENLVFTDKTFADNLILVGSVDPLGRISDFSNRPGETCITTDGACREIDKLKYRFLVAPGEFVLVSDGAGGVTRRSGTSLAAPLVTGAIALMHSHWPWLQDNASATAAILLNSSTDLGAPGVDGVYGWGLLNVEGALSPLNSAELAVAHSSLDTATSLATLGLYTGAIDIKVLDHQTLVAVEQISGAIRDFSVSVSSVSQSGSGSASASSNGANGNGNSNNAANKLTHGFTQPGATAQSFSFSDVRTLSAPLAGETEWRLSMTASSPDPDDVRLDGSLPFHTGFALSHPKSGFEVSAGTGHGALALRSQSGFAMLSDHSLDTGGVNPFLGLASGGAYASMGYRFAPGLSLSVGFTENYNEHTSIDSVSGQEVNPLNGFAPYDASAIAMNVAYQLNDRATLTAGYTHLNEDTGLLGAQGASLLSLSGGSETDAATFGAEYAASGDITLSASATLASTTADHFDASALALGDDGLTSTAFQVAFAKTGVFEKHDGVRLAISQPMHIESGALEYTSLQVINRQTGELGQVTDVWNLSGAARDFVVDTLYAKPVFEGRAEIAGFSQVEFDAGELGDATEVTVGSRFKLDF